MVLLHHQGSARDLRHADESCAMLSKLVSWCCELGLKDTGDPLILAIHFLLAKLSPYSSPPTDIHLVAYA